MISVSATEGYVLDMDFRMPFHFGDTEIVSLPHLFLTIDVEIDGETATGIAAECLSPLWFVKNSSDTFAEGTERMLLVVEAACEHARAADPADSPFDLWHAVYEAQQGWGEGEHPPLLWGFGVTLIERALIDAYCCHRNTTFPEAVADGALGIEPGRVYPELDGVDPAERLADPPAGSATLRHTVGFTDPLTEADIGEGARLNDGLPQTLSEYINAQGLTHFKIKLSGDVDADTRRLADLAGLFDEEGLDDYVVTLDANEQYETVDRFRAGWETIAATNEVEPLLDAVAYVEQPLNRHEAMTDRVRTVLAEWDGCPPVIIDESDARTDSLRRALDCGYAGTSHKNCKGVFRSLVNACLIAARREENPERTYVLSGEDLTTVGPVALPQDLAVVSVLGIGHVERNGHHYFRGLSMLPDALQESLLAAHDDLYREHAAGFPVLDVTEGQFAFGSTVDAPFGYDLDFDQTAFTPMGEYAFDPSA